MLNLFKESTSDVKQIRSNLIRFIKEKLQKATGGEGGNITGIHLFINCTESERYLYEAAIFFDVPGKFKNEEVQRMADDYAIQLPDPWKFEIAFTDKYPERSYKIPGMDAALFIATRKGGLTQTSRAFIKILNGQAEKETYLITDAMGKVNIGRETKVQLAAGHVRMNAIAFVSSGDTNRSVSRQHAHIQWEPGSGSFLAFADAGGIPPSNKMKIRTAQGLLIKMQAIEVGHRLEEGDQLILGDAAVLEFSYSTDEK